MQSLFSPFLHWALLPAACLSLTSAVVLACSSDSATTTDATHAAGSPASPTTTSAPTPASSPAAADQPTPDTTTARKGPKRLRFAKGAITLQVRGRLTADPKRDDVYVFEAQAGQHLLVHTSGLSNTATDVAHNMVPQAFLTPPAGAEHAEKGPLSINETLTTSGDYRLRVGRNQMASNSPAGEYLLEIVVY